MKHLNHILCPVDFSENSYAAIEKASFLAQLFQADLTLLHVLSVLPRSFGVVWGRDRQSEEDVAQATEKARSLLRAAKQKYVPYAVTCKSSIRVGKVSEEIIQEAETLNADLIVMAMHGAKLSEASLTTKVISHSTRPVLTYYAHPAEGEESRKGFRRILIPVDPVVGISELSQFVVQYLSMMSPEVLLLTILNPEAAPQRIEQAKRYLDNQARMLSEAGLRRVRSKVMLGELPAQHINRIAVAEGCDLIMLNTHDKKDRPKAPLGTVASSLVNTTHLPLFTLRPGTLVTQ
jgi:nucleotide-binding universal stress UspA family protein